jgi:cytochrome P450
MPFPSRVICELLGLPYAEHEYFESRTQTMMSRAAPAVERTRSAHEVRAFLDEVVTGKERHGTDDLLGRLIARQRADGGVDHEAVVSMAFVMLVAGHVTTANMISLGALALLCHPDQRDKLIADPARLRPAVEELLRYLSIVEAATARTAVADTEVGGVPIRAGEGVVAVGLAANRDPEVFDHPDELDIDRDRRQHVAFGFGPHQCVGQNLARLELQVALGRLFARAPALRLAVPVAELSFKEDANIFGVHALPVTW